MNIHFYKNTQSSTGGSIFPERFFLERYYRMNIFLARYFFSVIILVMNEKKSRYFQLLEEAQNNWPEVASPQFEAIVALERLAACLKKVARIL